MRISDWSSDVCSSDLHDIAGACRLRATGGEHGRAGHCAFDDQRKAACIFVIGKCRSRQPGLRDPPAAGFNLDADVCGDDPAAQARRSEEHTSELQSLMRISYAVFCLKKNTTYT